MLLAFLLLHLGNALLHLGPELHGFSGLPVGDKQRLGQLGKLLVDVRLLQPAPVGREPLVQRDRVALGVLPVGDARGNLPLLLLLDRDLARGRVEDRCGRGRRAARYLLVRLETRRLHRVLLHLDHADDALLGARVEAGALLRWRVPKMNE